MLAMATLVRDRPPTMIDVRLVCTHDGVNFAEALMRLLGAEEHQVFLSYGRTCMKDLEVSKAGKDAVVLIWSHDAPSQLYMHEWARSIDPARLVEVGRTPAAPRNDKRAPPIDFTSWRGERGGRAWSALNERLRAVAHAVEPPRPGPRRAAMAMGLVSAAAVTGAVFVRANDTLQAVAPAETDMIAANETHVLEVGGPIEAVEPASMPRDVIEFHARQYRAPSLEERSNTPLVDLPIVDIPELRDPTLMERLAALNLLPSSVIRE